MKGIILAGGKSTRTWPLTLTRPKPLLKVANRAVIEHNLEQLAGLVDEVIIVIGFMGEKIKTHLGNSYRNVKLTYVEQNEQLGTANALASAEKHSGERFMLMYGDDMYDKEDIKKCMKHKNAILVAEVRNPENFGTCIIKNDALQEIKEKQEKPESNIVNTGFYVFEKIIFEEIKNIKKSKRGEYELTDAVNLLAKKKEIVCETAKAWLQMPFSWSLLDANEVLLKGIKTRIEGTVEAHAHLHGEVIVGQGTIIKHGAYIEGPVIIGKNCTIGPNCYIRPSTSIGDSCKIGNAVEIKNSIIMDNTHVAHLSYVGDSVLGEHVNLGAGTIIANLRHDNTSIKSMVKGALVDTGRRKLGAIIGDHVKTGISTKIYPGRKIWPNKTTLPGEIVRKDIME